MIFRQILAQIKHITTSNILPDPIRAERAMVNLIKSSFRVCKSVLVKDLMNVLMKLSIGTNQVEHCVKRLCRYNSNSVRKGRDAQMVKFIMSRKLHDAEFVMKEVKKEYCKRSAEYKSVIPSRCRADLIFRNMMSVETDRVWREGKIKHRNKVRTLKNRYVPKEQVEASIRDIKYRDADLETLNNNHDINEPRLYGGVNINNAAKNVLNKDPNYMLFENIDQTEIEVEIEKGLAKARYEIMSAEEEEKRNSGNTNNMIRTGDMIEHVTTTLNYANLRATDIPTVSRIFPPKPASVKIEKVIDNIKVKLLETVAEYSEKHCDSKGKIKEQNITREEEKALKNLKKDIKEKKIIVSTTDKSGRFCVDSPENYMEAVMKHTRNDLEVENERVKQVENKMNQHMRQFNKMFMVGKYNKHEARVESATHSTNTDAPPMYGLKKDHKQAEDPTKGPAVRPVCASNESPNSCLSNSLSRIINDFADTNNIKTECRSSEEMRASFEEYNNNDPETMKKCAVISMDVDALYPSMDWDEIIISVRELIESSVKEMDNVDYEEVGKYLAVTLTKEEVKREGLEHVIPKRKIETGREITVAYLYNKANEDKWLKARVPGVRQRRKMVAMAVSEGVKACMSHHVYCIGDKKFIQLKGGPIGLELTGAVSRAFMGRWDKMYLEKVKEAGVEIVMFERYVDDSNQIAVVPPPGTRYDENRGKIIVDLQQQLQAQQIKPDDERLAEILKQIANSIMPCVIMKADWPSKNLDKKMPILDMKVWTNKEGVLYYQHYEKEVSSKTVLHSQSAHSGSCKRGVHTQEVLRRLMNSSKRLDWEEETAPVVTEYMRRMKVAGYGEKYRRDVLKHAINIFDKKWEDDKNGKRPIFRPKDWKREERRLEKKRKKHNWAKVGGHIAPIFVPTTPGGVLMKMMRKVAEEEARDGIKFKILEVGGRTLKSELQRSNPTATPGCDKSDCLPCSGGRGKGGKCHKNNVNYIIECHLCPEGKRFVYWGETSRNLYTRCKEHLGDFGREGGDGDSHFMRTHMEEYHPGMESKFVAKVTNVNRDSMTRQIREGVNIRRSKRPVMNTKSEWFQPPIYRVQSEIVRE